MVPLQRSVPSKNSIRHLPLITLGKVERRRLIAAGVFVNPKQSTLQFNDPNRIKMVVLWGVRRMTENIKWLIDGFLRVGDGNL